jgi:hypothetical protein
MCTTDYYGTLNYEKKLTNLMNKIIICNVIILVFFPYLVVESNAQNIRDDSNIFLQNQI